MFPQLINLLTKIKGFLSYAREDGGDFARHLGEYFDEKQYNVFLDTKDLNVGAKWKDRIESRIDDSDFFVLVITPGTIESTEVKEEVSIAIKKRKVLMLFKYESVRLEDLEEELRQRTYHEFKTKEALVRVFDEAFREIDEKLSADLSNAFVVEEKIKALKQEFDSLPDQPSAATITGYADDIFIVILAFLKKSPIFYPDEVKAIEMMLGRVISLNQTLEENQDTFGDLFIRSDVDMLKKALKGYLDYLVGSFTRNPPEKRKQAMEHKEVEVHVEPLPAETKNFMTILVDRSLSEYRKRELFKQDIENQKIDIKFFFLEPESIMLWLKIINFAQYKLQQLGRELIANKASELVEIMLQNSQPPSQYLDYISLGVGAGIKDYFILNAILEKMPKEPSEERINYIPVDYSFGILQKGIDFLDDIMDTYPNKLHVEGILGDFFQLVRYSDMIHSRSKSPKVFSLLGNIFGNVDEDTIMDVITRTMNPNDLLLLEVDLIDGRTEEELKQGYGSDPVTREFLMNPIINYFKAERKHTKSKIDTYKFDIKLKGPGQVPESRTVVTSAYYGEQSHEKIHLIHSRKYELKPLLEYLLNTWKLDHIKTYREQNACILLLGKRRADTKSPIQSVSVSIPAT